MRTESEGTKIATQFFETGAANKTKKSEEKTDKAARNLPFEHGANETEQKDLSARSVKKHKFNYDKVQKEEVADPGVRAKQPLQKPKPEKIELNAEEQKKFKEIESDVRKKIDSLARTVNSEYTDKKEGAKVRKSLLANKEELTKAVAKGVDSKKIDDLSEYIRNSKYSADRVSVENRIHETIASASHSQRVDTSSEIEGKTSKVRENLSHYDKVVFFVPNSPNYGEQAINLKAVNALREYLPADRTIYIATDDSEFKPIDQDVTFKVRCKEGYKLNIDELYKEYSTGGTVESINGKTVLTVPNNISASWINASELDEFIQDFSDGNARVILGPGYSDGEDPYDPIGDIGQKLNKYNYPDEHTFNFQFKQEKPETAEGKLLKLDPKIKDRNIDFVSYNDIKKLRNNDKETVLVLAGAKDSRSAICGNENADGVTEIHMADKDHSPDKARAVYIDGQPAEFPEGIDLNAKYVTSIDVNAIEQSNLSDQEKRNLQALLESDSPILYAYGFHQVPTENGEAETLMSGMVKGLEGRESREKRPVIIVAGEKGIPDTGDSSITTKLNDSSFISALQESKDKPLIVMAGSVPSPVNNLILTKSRVVLAEGKGTISICQEKQVPHLILKQQGDEGTYNFVTSYHEGDVGVLEKMSEDLYDRDKSAQAIRDLFENTESFSNNYSNMASDQNLLLETLSRFQPK